MANRWINNGNSERFYFGGAPKSLQMRTAAMKLKDACSLEKSNDQPKQHIKKPKHYFATKFHLVKALVFQVDMYGCESWTLKKSERQRIDAFWIVVLEKTLSVHWTVRRSNQSILKEISPEYSLEGLMLKLKLQYFDLMQRAKSLEKTLMLGKIESKRRRECQRIKWLDSITD